jgi:lysophospholipase
MRSPGAPLYRVEGGFSLPPGEAEWVQARSGRRLRVAKFVPSEPCGSVVLSTGRTEPLEKYGEVISDLVARGFTVLAHDWAGQGLSARFGSDRMAGDVIGGANAFLGDLRDLLDAFTSELPEPWLAVAHSMGAALTALALADGESRFAAACLCAPMVQFAVGKLPFGVVQTVVGLAGLARFGTKLAREEVDPAKLDFEGNPLTHDRERFARARALYAAHPELQLGAPTWRWLSFAVELRDRLLREGAPERIACPVACLIAGDDSIVDSAAIERFARRLPHGSITRVPGAFHEILMEQDEQRGVFFREFDALAARVTARAR